MNQQLSSARSSPALAECKPCPHGNDPAWTVHPSLVTLLVAGCITAAFLVAFVLRSFPLGLPGQWEWARYGVWDPPLTAWPALIPAGLCALALAAWTCWALGHVETSRPRFLALALAGVMLFGALFQMFLEVTSPTGLQKWASLYFGARSAARDDFSDVDSVMRDHAKVIADLEPTHVSANPVGWILVFRILLSFFDAHGDAASLVWQAEPDEMAWALRNRIPGGTPLADQAAIASVAFANRLVVLLVPLPLAWLVGQRHGRRAAVAAAALAMVIPMTPLLAPWTDAVYATWATLIWALACHASRRRSWAAAACAGSLVGLGMIFSLAFLIVGAVAALFVIIRAIQGCRPTMPAIAAALAGWAAALAAFPVFGHFPWETWRVNLAKNREFNLWSGCTYTSWILINLLELAVAMGVPVSVYLVTRIASEWRRAMSSRGAVCLGPQGTKPGDAFGGPGDASHEVLPPRRSIDALLLAWMAMILMLDLAGTNRGEICRLWYFFMPVGAALAIERFDFGSRRGRGVLAALLILQAIECSFLSREMELLWTNLPHDTFETFLKPGNKTWATVRRLSEEEFRRRQAAP